MRYLIIAISFSLSLTTVAQTSNFENWLSVRLRYRIVKPLELQVKLGYRSVDFDSDNTHIDVALKYSVHKYLRLAIGWRHAGLGDPLDVDAIVNRFHVEASSKLKLAKRLNIKPRLRYQIRFKDWFESALGHLPKHHIRLRLLLNYKLHKRWLLIGGGELFTSFHYASDPAFASYRVITGISHSPKKNRHSVSLYYNFEQSLSSGHMQHIIALVYQLNLNKLFKKK